MKIRIIRPEPMGVEMTHQSGDIVDVEEIYAEGNVTLYVIEYGAVINSDWIEEGHADLIK